jgi:hypothetical protein
MLNSNMKTSATSRSAQRDQPYLDQIAEIQFQPIFILGDHRSGTTLLYKTLELSKCFNIARAYHIIKYEEVLYNYINKIEQQQLDELYAQFEQLGISDRKFDSIQVSPELPEEYGFILRNAGYEPYLYADSLDTFREMCRKVQFTGDCQKPILLKNPWCYPHFGYIQQVFPQARFVFIHRHPIEVINSKLKAVDTVLSSWNPYTGLISKRYRKIFRNPINRLLYRMMYSKRFNIGVNKVLKQAIESTAYFLETIGTVPEENYVSVRFEDLCEQPQATLQKIFDGLQLSPEINIDYASLIHRRPVRLLPAVEQNQRRIYETLMPYYEFHGYAKT